MAWIVINNGECPNVIHYMDDFLFVGKAETNDCQLALSYMNALCDDLGVRLRLRSQKAREHLLCFWV